MNLSQPKLLHKLCEVESCKAPFSTTSRVQKFCLSCKKTAQKRRDARRKK